MDFKKTFKPNEIKALPISGVREVKGKTCFFNGSKQLLFSLWSPLKANQIKVPLCNISLLHPHL